MKKLSLPLFIAAMFLARGSLLAADRIDIQLQLRLYQALPAEGAAVFIRWRPWLDETEKAAHFYTGSLESPDPRPEEAEIKKVFKVDDLQIIADNAVKISFNPDAIKDKSTLWVIGWWDGHYVVRGPLLETALSDGKTYALRIIPIDVQPADSRYDVRRFKLQIHESTQIEPRVSAGGAQIPSHFYVDVDFSLPVGHTTIIGFADTKDTPYFLSVKLDRLSGVLENFAFSRQASRTPRQFEMITESTALLPEALVRTEPVVYPQACRDQGIEGDVELEVAVNAKGRPEHVKVLRGVHPELDKAAIDAVEKWIFKPRLIEGRPAPAVYKLAVEFRIRESPGAP